MKFVHLYILLFVFIFCTSCEGQNKTDPPSGSIRSETKITPYAFNSLIANTSVAGKGVIIKNSLPKGGSYTSPAGRNFGYRIFWTHVVNKTATPLEITINFPADSLAISRLPGSYLKLFLPPGEMTLDKESLYDYGATGLKSFIDTGLNKPTRLQKTIPPNGEYLFYVGLLYHAPDNFVRTRLVLKEQDLFYRVSWGNRVDSVLAPCGHIIFKK